MRKLKVNGASFDLDVDESTPLLWVIREQLGLTGTKYSCGISLCGACTVHIDGKPVRACAMPLSAVPQDSEVTTIEGLSEQGDQPVQLAWAELDIPQCGYCQPGMIMAVAGLLDEIPDASDEEIDRKITNICRCGTFQRVRKGIHLAKTKQA